MGPAGPDDPTLMAWHRNFEAHWNELSTTYDERFRRMWRYYLLSCAGTFRARRNQVWQIVYSHEGVLGGHGSEGPAPSSWTGMAETE